jgi:CRISPR-associated protein (TIGR02710 family)
VTEISCKALITVVSRTEAIDTAVEALRPEVVGVISSQDVMGAVGKKSEELGSRTIFRFRLVDSPIEIHDSFERFEHLFSELEELGYTADEVVLDASGGTTPMRLGAALAANTRGIQIVYQKVIQRYLAGDWVVDKDRPREVVPIDNPLESTGLLREGQAIELFNRRDYVAASLVFEDIAKKVTGVERSHYYNGLLLLSGGYAAWDVADYGTALEKLKLAREELSVGFAEAALAERAAEITGRITAHLPFLGQVRGKLSVENVVDMAENARRRITDQGRYDDGVARLYRCVEMWHQWRLLAQHSISTKKVEWRQVDKDAQERFFEATKLTHLPEALDLVRARALDRILSADLPEDDNVLRDLLRQRNSSILAHGLQPIGEASARRFLEYVDGMIDEPEVRRLADHTRLREL